MRTKLSAVSQVQGCFILALLPLFVIAADALAAEGAAAADGAGSRCCLLEAGKTTTKATATRRFLDLRQCHAQPAVVPARHSL